MFRKLKRYLRDPYHEIGYDMLWRHPNWMSDKWFLKSLWKRTFGYELDLARPKTFNEKLQWLKLHDRKPEYTTMVDKYLAKQWVVDRIGKQYVIPTLSIYESVDEIDLDKLPDKFVLKCNHDSGSVVICKDKCTFDLCSAKQKLAAALKRNYYLEWREWPYKNVKPCVMAEAFLEDLEGVNDYKFFCFNGKVRALFVATERQNEEKETRFDFFDENYNHLDFTNGHPNAEVVPEKPVHFVLMKNLSETLSKEIPHVRVDFYEVKGRVYFGEMTFYHWGGFMPFQPKKWDDIFGGWIVLPTDRS